MKRTLAILMALVLVLALVIAIYLLFVVFRGHEAMRYTDIHSGGIGGITISYDTIKQIAETALKLNDSVQLYTVRVVSAGEEGIDLHLSVSLRLDVKMHEVVAALQQEIATLVEEITSIQVKQVFVRIDTSKRTAEIAKTNT